MMVLGDGRIVGTIGGGRIEKEVADAALALLAEGDGARAKLLRYHLTHELAMCCGGEMEVFVEPLIPAPPLVVCGGGHVARALVPLASSVGLRADRRRRSWRRWRRRSASPTRRASSTASIRATGRTCRSTAHAYVVIVTRDHAQDQALLEHFVGRELAYLGLIGSRRKIEMFKQRLDARGVDQRALRAAARADRARHRRRDARGDRGRHRRRADPGARGAAPAKMSAAPGRVAAVVLAAGASTRMGEPKALLRDRPTGAALRRGDCRRPRAPVAATRSSSCSGRRTATPSARRCRRRDGGVEPASRARDVLVGAGGDWRAVRADGVTAALIWPVDIPFVARRDGADARDARRNNCCAAAQWPRRPSAAARPRACSPR